MLSVDILLTKVISSVDLSNIVSLNILDVHQPKRHDIFVKRFFLYFIDQQYANNYKLYYDSSVIIIDHQSLIHKREVVQHCIVILTVSKSALGLGSFGSMHLRLLRLTDSLHSSGKYL